MGDALLEMFEMSARILIVEDEQITAEDLRDILGEFGYTVTGVVSNGAAAIEYAERELPDMALMDIRIKGDIDGIETALVLRERFNVPVVYLTAHADGPTIERGKAARPLGYITKPFKQPALQASIEIALYQTRRISRQDSANSFSRPRWTPSASVCVRCAQQSLATRLVARPRVPLPKRRCTNIVSSGNDAGDEFCKTCRRERGINDLARR